MDHDRITIQHPSYSPDLASCDFRLFSLVKSQLVTHLDVKRLKKKITEMLFSIDKKEYAKTYIRNGLMQHCINNNGDYFEHLIKVTKILLAFFIIKNSELF
jgi:hypothetical protein